MKHKDSKAISKAIDPPTQKILDTIFNGFTLISETTKMVFKMGDFRLKAEIFHACVQCRKRKMSKGCRHFFKH